MLNYLREYGPKLITNGYSVVPIKRGTKAPMGVPGWQNIKADLNQLGKWASAGFQGVGVLCKNSPAVDIDIMDSDVSALMVKKVTDMFDGQMYTRVGKAPKTLLAFRTEKPFRKVRSKTYEDQFGDRHAVEVLGDGQQYIAYAEHPDTLRPYQWTGPGIDGVVHGDLPAIEHRGALQIVRTFEEIAEEKIKTDGWIKVQDGTLGSVGEEPSYAEGANEDGKSPLADFANLRPRLRVTDQEVKSDLACLSADDYDRWIRVGMALYHQYAGSSEGLDIWDTWSQKSSNYTDEGSLSKRWSGFAPKGSNRRQITFASVRRWARDARMDEDPMSEFIERYVYVADGDSVHDLGGLGHNKPWDLREFRNMTENIRKIVDTPAPIATNEDRTVEKDFPVHKLWLRDAERKTALTFKYLPGGPRVLEDGDGAMYINRFHMPEFPDPCFSPNIIPSKAGELNDCQEDLLGVYFRHMEYLFPIEVERNWMYNWMAFNLQFPGVRCKVTPLLIATDHGTGRGWLAQLMSALLGSWNCTKTKMSTLNGDSSAGAYQDFMNDSLLCCIEEVRDADKPYAVDSKIRDYLTENTLEINIKYGAKETKTVYTNMMFQSNHVDAMVLKPEDRRINVFLTTSPPKGADYYDRLYAWLECKDSSQGTSGISPQVVGPPLSTGSVSVPVGGLYPSVGDICDPFDEPEIYPSGDSETNEISYEERLAVIEKDLDRDEKLFDLAGVKVGPGVACLWHWLMNRDLTGFNSHRSFHNKARADLIKNSQTDVEELFLEMMRDHPYPVMSMDEIQRHIENEKCSGGSGMGGEFDLLSDSEKRQIKKLVQHNMVRFDQIQVTKKLIIDPKSGKETTEKLDKNLKIRPWGLAKSVEFSTGELREMYERRFLDSLRPDLSH
jgi:hypothetical protein